MSFHDCPGCIREAHDKTVQSRLEGARIVRDAIMADLEIRRAPFLTWESGLSEKELVKRQARYDLLIEVTAAIPSYAEIEKLIEGEG